MTNREELLELRIAGIDCSECAQHLESELAKVPGVTSVRVLLSSEKAVMKTRPDLLDMEAVEKAIASEGCSIAPKDRPKSVAAGPPAFGRSMFALLGLIVAGVVVTVVVGEILGLFDWLTQYIPWPIGWVIVIAGGYPVLSATVRDLTRFRITSSTMMSVGAVAALVTGHWPVALVVMVFMRVSDYVERFTSEQGRQAVKELLSLAPRSARVERAGDEIEVPIAEVRPGEVVVVRPGAQIPVDGEVISGQATVNQASITGESMPVEVAEGDRVFASSIAQLGSLRVKTERLGVDSTFGRIVRMVEDAETHRADVQRLADRFATYYLPVVAVIAAATYLISHNPLATVAVLVVAYSCSFALATPIAILASVGAAAKKGLLVKGGKYLEVLARADFVLIDKTGTLTHGLPRITDVVPLNGLHEDELLQLAASAERYSEHPLAEAIRQKAVERELTIAAPLNFRAIPGVGVTAEVDGAHIGVGRGRVEDDGAGATHAERLEIEGKTLLSITRNAELVGILAASDTIRSEVPDAIRQLKQLGISRIELLTGDNERVAAALARELGVAHAANLLPEDKIARVRELQGAGHRVVMVGDGVNDAPALAQADVGIAMGAAGSDIAMEAAHVALLRDDWSLVPEAIRIARRTMGTVKLNLGFTVVYNLVGLSLAAVGILPPVIAAAAQSMPDFVIVGNSARLLRQR